MVTHRRWSQDPEIHDAHHYRVDANGYQLVRSVAYVDQVFVTRFGIWYLGEEGLSMRGFDGMLIANQPLIKRHSRFIAIAGGSVVASNVAPSEGFLIEAAPVYTPMTLPKTVQPVTLPGAVDHGFSR